MKSNYAAALTVAVVTYGAWGLLPVYWKLFGQVAAYEVLAHRIIWSFVFMVLLTVVTGRVGRLVREARELMDDRRRALYWAAASVIISFNWLTFIWAVNHDRVVESGLGYYISPLFSVLAGVVILRERLAWRQLWALVLAAAGVFYLTFNYGSFPLVAVTLATTITIYGLCKKAAGLTAINGMTLETALTAPAALVFLWWLHRQGQAWPLGLNATFLYLVGAGAVTAVPLIMFAYSLNRLPLTVLGPIQYISPTLTLLLGVFAYGEVFTRTHLVSFILIWAGIVLFMTAPQYWKRSSSRS